MSGGVDSTAAAIILKDAGYEVTGITYILTDGFEAGLERAYGVATKLNIEHIVIDARDEFFNGVIEPFVSEYERGSTPNPCIMCNQRIKFNLLEKNRALGGYDFIATGHYARKAMYNDVSGKTHTTIRKGKLLSRDQSYFLHSLPRHIVDKCIFPLGELSDKREAEEILKSELINPYKSFESRGICFAPDGYAAYIKSNVDGDFSGFFVDSLGNEIAEHDGYYKYTLGQKRGLGFDLEKGKCVTRIDPNTGNVYIGDEALTYRKRVRISGVNWLVPPSVGMTFEVKLFQWGHILKAELSKLYRDKTVADLVFESEVRAPVSGQSAVLYDGDFVLGGGVVIL